MIPAPALKQAGHERPSDTDRVIDSETDRQAILEQLDRLLASPAFRGSKRLSGFLRFIVEQTLEDRGADLKERVIGVQVFGRATDYDTSAEPVVRVSAGDLRKRIAQYYHEPGHENELRIDLPTGSYHPVFHLAPAAVTMENDALLAAAAELIRPPLDLKQIRVEVASAPASRWLSRRAILSYATVAAAGVAVTSVIASPGNPYEQFWGPVLAEKGSVLIFVGAGRQDDNRMVMEDALALVNLSGTLSRKNRAFRVLKAPELSPETLKQGPSLLIGAFTNQLARRLTQQLRFTFAHEGELPEGFGYIQDRQNLGRKDWSTPSGPLGASPTFTDYAVVSRVIDPVTDRSAVVSGGIRRFGTLAASEFLSHPEQIVALASNAPRDWRKKNMQAVLAVGVRDGKLTGTRVVASYFW